MIDVPQGEEFVLSDGQRLQNIEDLYLSLANMPDEHFDHHVNEEKNDFATWIEHSVDDKFLASNVRQIDSKEQLLKTLFMTMYC
ncbi:MAG: DUF5752 family protein [Candidatus Woesearchaeota archaeon]|nr:DUF5752 family protein [Candidatus Woesearchaeota archaeon]